MAEQAVPDLDPHICEATIQLFLRQNRSGGRLLAYLRSGLIRIEANDCK